MPVTATVAFLAVLVGCTLLAVLVWYRRRGETVPEAERKVFARFVFGLVVFWLVAIGAYLWSVTG